MAVTRLTDAGTGSGLNARRYPNPFFDISSTIIPKNIKTLFGYCRNFFYTNGFLRNVITKLTEYPITDVLYVGSIDQATKEKYDEYLHESLKLKSFLIEVGLDYFTYGNCFIATQFNPKRFLTCPSCKTKHLIEKVTYKFRRFSFEGECPNCKNYVTFKVEDETIIHRNNLKFVRLSPENIDIDYNPITGDTDYYYSMPNKIKQRIIQGDKNILKNIPITFINSLKEKKKITFNSENLYHFKRPTLAEEDMGWGKPILLPALKEVYYLQLLKKGNEAIANEHIVPKKSIFPANTTGIDPFTQMSLGKWRSKIEEQVGKWKTDPNHIGIFPIPIGYQELGGNARMLMLTPEMKFIEESIINSLGVPLEFIKGGTTWTGSSISLRIVENHFLTYRELLLDFINNFILVKARIHLKYPNIKIKFKKFKMTDDSEAKQLALQLSETGKISDKMLLDEFGIDSVENDKQLRESKKEYYNSLIETGKANAEAEGAAMEIMARYQVRAQHMAQSETLRIKTELFQEELAQEHTPIPDDPVKLIEKFVQQLVLYTPDEQQLMLAQMKKDMPITASMVIEQLLFLNRQYAEESPEEIEAPKKEGAPKKKVTEKDKVKIGPDKKKGPTKGSP